MWSAFSVTPLEFCVAGVACCFYHFLHVYLHVACFNCTSAVVSACLILACLQYFLLGRPAAFHTHTHTCGQVTGLARVRYDRQSPTALHVLLTSLVWTQCPVYGRFWHVCSLPICFLHVYYFLHVYLPACVFCRPATCFGMFDFGMFKYLVFFHAKLLHSTHTHTHLRPGAGLARGRQAGPNCA